MAQIASLVLTTLSLFLGMFFFFIGFIKLSPALNKDIHREIRRSFVRYAKVVPLAEQMGVKVSPRVYRQTIGYLEIVTGLMLAFFPDRIKLAINVFLFTITFGAIYTHWMIDDEIDKMYPALAFTCILLSRLALHFMVRKQRQAEAKLEAKQAELYQLQQQVANAVLSAETPSLKDKADSTSKSTSPSQENQTQLGAEGQEGRKSSKRKRNRRNKQNKEKLN